MSDYLCNDCLDTGWIEDREGKTVCACISETEPYQLLRAEVEALKEWRPIDTAPQDGSLLLLGWWRTWPEVEWECEVKAAGNMDTGRRGTRWMHGQATHWMPLPEPPALRGEEDE